MPVNLIWARFVRSFVRSFIRMLLVVGGLLDLTVLEEADLGGLPWPCLVLLVSS